MVDELEEARERARAAWALIQADAIRLKEAVRTEVDIVRQFGPKAFFQNHPLPFVGVAAGLGLVMGVRGGRRKAAYRAIVRAGTDVVSTAAQQMTAVQPKKEKSLKRKLFDTLLLAIASKGAELAAHVAQERVQSQLLGAQPQQPPPVREERHVVIPGRTGNL